MYQVYCNINYLPNNYNYTHIIVAANSHINGHKYWYDYCTMALLIDVQ